MWSLTSRRWLLVLSLLAAIGVIAAVIGVTDYAAIRAYSRYDHERQHLSADLRAAQLDGYTTQDLMPVTEPLPAPPGQPGPAPADSQGPARLPVGCSSLVARRAAEDPPEAAA